jgi:hypothetical protein
MTEQCPHCELTYEDFRTGETYRSIFELFWVADFDPSRWVNKRRRTILGRWREIKQKMWEEHLLLCEMQAAHDEHLETVESAEVVEGAEALAFDLDDVVPF